MAFFLEIPVLLDVTGVPIKDLVLEMPSFPCPLIRAELLFGAGPIRARSLEVLFDQERPEEKPFYLGLAGLPLTQARTGPGSGLWRASCQSSGAPEQVLMHTVSSRKALLLLFNY